MILGKVKVLKASYTEDRFLQVFFKELAVV